MYKKCTIMAAALIMSASPALAQQWKNLGTFDASTYYFYNPKTFTVAKDNTIGTWTKREFGVDSAAMAKENIGPDKYIGSKSVVAYEEFDCLNQKKKTVTGLSYDNLHDKKTDVARTEWQEVAKNSLEGNLLDAVCRQPKAGE